MKILQICSKPPFPEKDGYALAVNHISNALIQFFGNNLKVMAISTPKHAAENIPPQYLSVTDFEHIFLEGWGWGYTLHFSSHWLHKLYR